MAVTIGNFTAINDSEVDAESPITESLVTRLRDNAYWINAGTNKTSESTANKFLETDGSGGVQWTNTSSIGVDGTKGLAALSITPATSIAIQTGKIMLVLALGVNGYETSACFIDASDDTYEGFGLTGLGNVTPASGTLSGSNQIVIPSDNSGSGDGIRALKNGSNYDFSRSINSQVTTILYIWL